MKLVKVAFDELQVGRRYGPFRYRITREQSENLRGPIGQARPGPSAPLGIFPVLFLRGFGDAMGGIPPGGILAREELEIDADLPAEGEVLVDVVIGEKLIKRDRPRAVIEFRVSAPRRGQAASGRMEIVWAPIEQQDVG